MDSTKIDHPTVLSIRIDTDGFSFLFYDETNRLITRKHIKTDLYNDDNSIALFRSQAELKANYSTINISCVSTFYTLVPLPLFQTDLMRPLLQLQCPDLAVDDTLLYHQIDSQDSVLIYALPSNIILMVEQLFPMLQIEHHLKQYMLTQPEENESLSIIVRKNDSDIIAFSNQKIIFANNLQHDCSEDLAYHILNCINELELNSPNCSCTLYGEHNTELTDLLSPHLAGLRIISKSKQDENYQRTI